MINDLDKMVTSAMEFTRVVTSKWPDRLTGRAACLECAHFLKEEFKTFGENVKTEEFDVHPGAFLGYIRINVVLYIIAYLCLWFQWFWIAVFLSLSAVIIMLGEFIYYKELVDPFFKKRKGVNVYTVIEPSEKIKQQIIISAHHDSAHIFNFLENNASWYGFKIFSGITFQNLMLIFSLIIVALPLIGIQPILIINIALGILGVGLLFVGQLWNFYADRGTPGAGDNMICVASAIEVGKYFKKLKSLSRGLRNTKLIIASWDSEECGLRGARNFVQRHNEELLKTKSYNLNLESFYDHQSMTFLKSDLNGLVPLSQKMVDECLEVAHSLGYKVHSGPFPMLAGGTDAAEMSKIGIEATCLAGMPFDGFGDHPAYHTSRDTIEAVDRKAVEICINVAINYILLKDAQALT